MKRRLALAAVAVGAVGCLSVGIAWACTPLPRSFMVSPGVAVAKDTTRVAGQGLNPGTPVEVVWNSSAGPLLGRAIADERGEFALPVSVPDAVPGAYAIVFTAPSPAGPVAVGRMPFRLASPGGTSALATAPAAGSRSAPGWAHDARGSAVTARRGSELGLGVSLAGAGLVLLSGASAAEILRRRRRSLSAT